ncbi:monocopper oxidase-like protein SKU5 [Cinnamomum micranthum f. kanehirae]|uniref:Monocopper oxidase-like protein SKU5 n=1 Tax=Cinnamomum micranthum f. kanehirae TaxID=337451 RepID=A0A3S3QZ62_9MAGN|nr:monocopper oxidase-like protein SKU5 [Cinnamomum micranthum f. kanehirae]
MDCTDIHRSSLMICVTAIMLSVVVAAGVIGDDIYLEWKVSLDSTIRPVNVDQPVMVVVVVDRYGEKGRVAAVCRAFDSGAEMERWRSRLYGSKKEISRTEQDAVGSDLLKWVWSRDGFEYGEQVITINDMFPGPLLNTTTNDMIHVNIFNNLDEPFLMTWNGVQQRLNSWQDGVSGTNCPIKPGKNWTYVFQMKDQIGSFIYFPSTRFQKAAGGFGPIRINNRIVIHVPFDKPEDDFDLLIGDWYNTSYKRLVIFNDDKIHDVLLQDSRITAGQKHINPQYILFNGKPPYNNTWGGRHESFTITKGKTYRFRISNVGRELSFNFRIQNHQMALVETEGSYTNKITLNSLDVHVGQSYSILVTANQASADYYIVATPTQVDTKDFPDTMGVGILHYSDSTTPATGCLPSGPDPLDRQFSVNQANSIRWNLTAGAARPNPQGSFNVSNVTISQTFILHSSNGMIGNNTYYAVNNVSYLTPETPLKLADYYLNGTGVYQLDAFPIKSINAEASRNTSVITGIHKGWAEIVLKNDLDVIDTWHLDGFGFFVVAFGFEEWKHGLHYNLYDPVERSTVQVYPKGWSVIYAYLDNPGMWNLRSQTLENWYLGQEIYIRVYDPDPNPVKEMPPPQNLLYCGIIMSPPPAPPPPSQPLPLPPPPPPPAPAHSSGYGDSARVKSTLITSIILIFLSKIVY